MKTWIECLVTGAVSALVNMLIFTDGSPEQSFLFGMVGTLIFQVDDLRKQRRA